MDNLTLNNLKIEDIYFSIGQLAKLIKVHPRTIRIYEKQGLIVPKRSLGNRRLYNIRDYEIIEFIQYLTRSLALNIAGVRLIMNVLKKFNINKDYIDFIKEISKITTDEENKNILKTSKRGRKCKTK